ncbi:hypothetical protein TSH7_10050 [Azospirillum sp. TSH7]|uniref:hypothetical protein n=1 Tax=unclassified Azospirillum TaxID=2630922 RepID=UPI000D60D7A1|nr:MULTISPECIES: hypothetical protein [unclassified Azospirillum]PWC64010.1 hypothetical protein TSH20_19145 [Azospirillum sp. TSH20]PWC64873.1 hypothetical protein TSH7_10050 [Azospirillum sp. TSH7]
MSFDPWPAIVERHNAALEAGDLLIWTIYDNPSDAPGRFVLRPFSSRNGQPDTWACTSKTAEALRELMQRLGLTCMPRQNGDDPVILESWL